MFWVYILRCADNSYYVGHSDDLEKRIAQHRRGTFPTCYTFNRRPIELVFSQDCQAREEALALERKLKGWSREKKAALIRNDWAEISRLARNKQQ
jgi:putative endonuclease